MDINKALADFRAGKLQDYRLADLRSMSAGCVVFIQNQIPDAIHLKAAIDDEIRRKETKESSDKLLQQTENLAHQTDKLVEQVTELVGIAAEQKRLAAKLDLQTDRLVALTIWLKGLTIGLLLLTLVLCIFEAFHSITAHKNPVRTNPHIAQSN
jgi:hypothetical protein